MRIVTSCKRVVIFLLLAAGFVSGSEGSGDDVCSRPDNGAIVSQPPELSSVKGKLEAYLAFRGGSDDEGLVRYCYVSRTGWPSPTLRVQPGDEVVLHLKNEMPASPVDTAKLHNHVCGGGQMNPASTNLHFHGLEIPPLCHQDEAIHTAIQPGGPGFEYRFRIPASQPPGLYWYHPHPHGFSEAQVLGGASGAFIVEGIEKVKPQVAGLPERLLILRDQPVPPQSKVAADSDDIGAKDVSLNFVPVRYPLYLPAVLRVKPARKEFWRVLNASADTYFVLQLMTVKSGQRVAANLQRIALDGMPVSKAMSAAEVTQVLISPGARAEFIVTTPAAGEFSQLVSRNYETGRDGASNPDRVLANLVSTGSALEIESVKPSGRAPWQPVVPASRQPDRERRIFFSEDREDLRTPGKAAKYFVTEEGKTPAVFDMNSTVPDITVRQGTVEDWIVENRAREAHDFHIHQLHFQVMGRDGFSSRETEFRDTIDLPAWDGQSGHYPTVKLRMDFRDPALTGTFPFHCHILEHEDGGMMGTVQVVPATR